MSRDWKKKCILWEFLNLGGSWRNPQYVRDFEGEAPWRLASPRICRCSNEPPLQLVDRRATRRRVRLQDQRGPSGLLDRGPDALVREEASLHALVVGAFAPARIVYFDWVDAARTEAKLQ